ncbi:protein trichome birefringence-like 31 [Phalaenopsis equestris]|uniref:protein trichome birefringence-like 31 n=1 Tax=Phalaenopsis equestris TaxID=78828 RepID=UPI0009E5CECA|nr:protein trichome birefringence-like 31 [Phalaenopsis equestris]
MRSTLTLLPLLLCSIFLFRTLKTAIKLSSSSHQTQHNKEFSISFNNGCNLFQGKWLLEHPSSSPLYTEQSCPYLTKQVTCRTNGRPDFLYQKWRWKPYGCTLPPFDAFMLLHSLRNKRLMFVGDSIQRTQWESMVCLLQSAVPDGNKLFYKKPPRKVFFAKDYNASIEFYWAPFLVESNSDHATKHRVQKRMVRLDSISNHSRQWQGVDHLVFESYVWWMYQPLINATIGSEEIREYAVPTAYRLALKTWTDWVESTLNPQTQKAFFMTLSPTHLWSWEWRRGSEGNCHNETYPIKGPFWGAGSSLEVMGAVKDAISRIKMINVTILNITQLSEFRKDGHTSVFTERRGKLLTREQRSEPNVYADCIHWCLPGVPDTWNEILYAYLVYQNTD